MNFLRKLAARPDLAVVTVLMVAVGSMIVPLPTTVVDIFLAANISISILLVMVAFYIRSAAQFTTLPALILLATLVRLSLSIAVTRLILTQAYAGEIIQAFGKFVVGGDVLVGLVIFLIITVVQFIVIAKGAERVAEVAARFMLDALPGKQLAIDADLRNGQLDQESSRARRQELERESHLYGAMDGAMKFVKGDAIAGLVIISVNLIGGLAIGMLQHGLSFSAAARTYSILTVGDGLVAQIPALLVAVTAGTVVTRIAGTESDNLGAEITGQVFKDNRAVFLAGLVAMLCAFVPGFPTLVFLAIGGTMMTLSALRQRGKLRLELAEAERKESLLPVHISRLRLNLGEMLAASVDLAIIAAALERRVTALGEMFGIELPHVDVVAAADVEPSQFRLDLDAVPLAFAIVPPECLLLTDDTDHAVLADIPVRGSDTLPGSPGKGWVDASARDRLRQFGIGFADREAAIVAAVDAILRENAAQFIGIQETKAILARYDEEWGDLVKEAGRSLPLQKMADLLRRLLGEGLTLRHIRNILEAVVKHGGESDAGMLAELVRGELKRQICYGHADPLRVIAGFVVDPEAEATLRAALRHTTQGGHLALPSTTTTALVERIRAELAASRGPSPVLVTAADLRRHLRALLLGHGLNAPVLAFSDLLPEFTLQALGSIRVPIESVRMHSASQGIQYAAE